MPRGADKTGSLLEQSNQRLSGSDIEATVERRRVWTTSSGPLPQIVEALSANALPVETLARCQGSALAPRAPQTPPALPAADVPHRVVWRVGASRQETHARSSGQGHPVHCRVRRGNSSGALKAVGVHQTARCSRHHSAGGHPAQ